MAAAARVYTILFVLVRHVQFERRNFVVIAYLFTETCVLVRVQPFLYVPMTVTYFIIFALLITFVVVVEGERERRCFIIFN